MQNFCKNFIEKLPKAELHVHIEGTMEPAQLLFFAERNKIKIPAHTLNQTKTAYAFSDFTSFCNAYWQATEVLRHEQDFYDLTYAYLEKISTQGVLHTEIFFDLQTYMPRNTDPAIIINGMHNALIDGKKHLGITGFLILCFLRHLSEADAFKVLELARPYKDKIISVGLAAIEEKNPPSKFEQVFAQAHTEGYRLVAHTGEDLAHGAMIRQALEKLHVERIDHGIGCVNDPSLIQELAQKKIPLTICPLSNVVLGAIKKLEDHPLKALFDAGIITTINSDDPAFFGGYIADNYNVAAEVLGFSCKELVTCARYSFLASFLEEADKKNCLAKLNDYAKNHICAT